MLKWENVMKEKFMKYLGIIFILFIPVLVMSKTIQDKKTLSGNEVKNNVYDFQVKDIEGKEIKLERYKGKVMLIVNVASKCGFTKQYAGLEKLYDKYKDQGFVVLGFPANNFMNQEPGSNSEIRQFCTSKFEISFPLFSKISVKGKDISPLYAYLTDKKTNPEFGGKISWNFNKFLIDQNGVVVNRFGSRTKPEDEKVIKAIENSLNVKKEND